MTFVQSGGLADLGSNNSTSIELLLRNRAREKLSFLGHDRDCESLVTYLFCEGRRGLGCSVARLLLTINVLKLAKHATLTETPCSMADQA